MDGKPLYEYARESIPLPRPIPVRECTVSIDLIDFRPASVAPGDGGHQWSWPKERLSSEEKTVFKRLTDIVHKASETAHDSKADPAVPDIDAKEVPETSPVTGLRPASFKVRMTVSSGTYVRSIVHDIGLALGCGAHVVTLTRTRQGEFSLHEDAEGSGKSEEAEVPQQPEAAAEETDEEAMMNLETAPAGVYQNPAPVGPSGSGGCIQWAVWQRALKERDEMLSAERQAKEEARANGMDGDEYHKLFSDEAVMKRRRDMAYKEWELEMLKRFQSVPVPIGGSGGTYRYR
jgi:tRNA pseudouridine55 synthase